MSQLNRDHLESIYSDHLIHQIHANLDLLLRQSKISRTNVDIIKNALSEQSNRSNPALPEPTNANNGGSFPQPTALITLNGYQESQATHHNPHLPSSFPPPPPPLAHTSSPQSKQARALWAYRGSAADDLSFEKGDIIVILAEENPDWWRGQVLNSQQSGGLFPSNHVEVINSVASQPQHSSSPHYNQHENHSIAHYPTGPPHGNPGYQSPAYSQPPRYGDHKAPQAVAPPPLQHTQSAPPVNITVEKPKKNLLQGRFGQALAGGAGFGAGSAVATHVVNAIL
ncbi:hypothetical protein PCANC_07940 [Puccinia coronata f. sp. avenae]|uniref:SH3 domain-containing protein n=1 Tax=Puccinia coronata f. sp. avenae TaxID=200324 RepID=A0A2N5SNY0_9BASI|nr:hypothetical protein PCASD_17382 [Puccinia coronata f. sp. avenae]PLW39944.1 hypothetical protein PCASD_06837 [Puccinia coronata f. sp. avenae]PLW42711.1 hypothetical protein PCANC_07940 [Puccinia coronata f. sp. avenae]